MGPGAGAAVSKPATGRRQAGRHAGVVKLLWLDSDEHAGMGILVGPRLVLTCAHVVNSALNLELLSQEQPAETIRLAFPLVEGPERIGASVVKWAPPQESPAPASDVALLLLEHEAPANAGLAVIADIPPERFVPNPLSIYGAPAGKSIGSHVDARLNGQASAAWMEFEGDNPNVTFIQPGFSGAGVWDTVNQAVIGMVVSTHPSNAVLTAYMIPAADLLRAVPDLAHEVRDLSPGFGRMWTAWAALTFLLVLAHWSVERSPGESPFVLLAIGGPYRELAAFWGMHVGALMLPPLLLMLISFAVSVR